MDKSKLIKWKTNPVLIGKEDVEELEKLSLEFPYFSLVQILLARGYKNTNHFRFNEQLKKAALYCEDRTWLYEFLNREELIEETPIEKVEESKPKEKTKAKEETPKPIITEKKEVVEEVKKVEPAVEETVEEVAVIEAERVAEKPFVLNKTKAWKSLEKVALKEKGEVVETAVKEAAKEEKKEAKKAPVKRRPVKKVTPKIPEVTEEVSGKEEVVEEPKVEKVVKEVKKKKSKKKGKKAKKRKTVVLDEQSLLDELINQNIQYNLEDYYSADEVLEPIEKEAPKEKTKEKEVSSEQESESHDFFAWLKQTEGDSSPVEGPKKDEKKPKVVARKKKAKNQETHKSISVIDDFLNAKKSTPRKKAEFFSPIEMAKRSDNIEGEIVSETLAGVYEQQERYEEAILTYEKLILLFPQKEAYFATRIKELRELSNK